MKFNLTKLNEPENISAEIICASQVEVKEVSWLWKGYIPFGKITLLQGDPGDGKSTFVFKGDEIYPNPFYSSLQYSSAVSDSIRIQKYSSIVFLASKHRKEE